jgi:hypothetical protein
MAGLGVNARSPFKNTISVETQCSLPPMRPPVCTDSKVRYGVTWGIHLMQTYWQLRRRAPMTSDTLPRPCQPIAGAHGRRHNRARLQRVLLSCIIAPMPMSLSMVDKAHAKVQYHCHRRSCTRVYMERGPMDKCKGLISFRICAIWNRLRLGDADRLGPGARGAKRRVAHIPAGRDRKLWLYPSLRANGPRLHRSRRWGRRGTDRRYGVYRRQNNPEGEAGCARHCYGG